LAKQSTSSTGDPGASRPARLIDLGVLDYGRAYQLQLEHVARRQRGAGTDVLLLVEHPHVITLGRSRQSLENVVDAGDIEVVQVERGGNVTYHGPGQLVAYPILALEEGERDLHRVLRQLEEAVMRTLARYGIDAGREQGKTGVWIDGRKLASIGIAIRKWVTFHGVALNVTTDLAQFQRIHPCGFPAGVMTNMAAETGRDDLSMAEVKRHLARDLGEVFGRRFE